MDHSNGGNYNAGLFRYQSIVLGIEYCFQRTKADAHLHLRAGHPAARIAPPAATLRTPHNESDLFKRFFMNIFSFIQDAFYVIFNRRQVTYSGFKSTIVFFEGKVVIVIKV